MKKYKPIDPFFFSLISNQLSEQIDETYFYYIENQLWYQLGKQLKDQLSDQLEEDLTNEKV